ncbi:MAG TPA: hypothetical protein VK674_07510 [Candidatus Limnocylindria bacterium]|nr:hypothetical protein [Candidatus Limnocylindria bacterium]
MIDELLRTHPLISDQVEAGELRVVLSELNGVIERNTVGDIVELGCYEGTTSLFIQRTHFVSRSRCQNCHIASGNPPQFSWRTHRYGWEAGAD